MSRILLYGGLFLLLAGFETGFLSSLPEPWSLVPVLPGVGIWLCHQKRSRIGWWYLLGWGLWYDLFSLSLWSPRTLVALGMMATLLYASGRLFSEHSIYGLLGLGLLTSLAAALVEALARVFSSAPLEVAFAEYLSTQLVTTLALLVTLLFLFLVDLRVRERLPRL